MTAMHRTGDMLAAGREAEQDRSAEGVNPRLAITFDGLDRAGVAWTLLRRTTDLRAPEGDLDLLVSEADSPVLESVLRELGYARLPFGPAHGAAYVLYDGPTDQWLWLDVATRLAFRAVDLPSDVEAMVLARRRKEGPAWVPAPDVEAWLLLAHLLSEGRVPAKRHRRRLRATVDLARTDSTLAARIALAVPGAGPGTLLDLVRREAWDELAGLARGTSARARSRSSFRGRVEHVLRRLATVTEPLHHPRRFRRRMGLGVAFLGPDGAGKSSTGIALARHYPFEARQVYMGMRGGVTSPDPGGAHIPGVSALIGVAIQWAAWFVGFGHMARGRLVVFDRYTEDPFLPPPSGETQRARLGRRIRALIACPAPDLTIVLDAPGEIMFRRKGEHTPERLERQRRRYLGLVGRMPNVVVVDAAAPAGEVRRAATSHLWRRYAKRLRGAGPHGPLAPAEHANAANV